MDINSNDISDMVSRLNDLLNTAERVQEEATIKADELTTIGNGLDDSNSKLGDAVSALEELTSIVEAVENLLSDAEEYHIT